MEALTAPESKSLLPQSGRHLPFTRPRAATLSGAVNASIIIFELILRIIVNI